MENKCPVHFCTNCVSHVPLQSPCTVLANLGIYGTITRRGWKAWGSVYSDFLSVHSLRAALHGYFLCLVFLFIRHGRFIDHHA